MIYSPSVSGVIVDSESIVMLSLIVGDSGIQSRIATKSILSG